MAITAMMTTPPTTIPISPPRGRPELLIPPLPVLAASFTAVCVPDGLVLGVTLVNRLGVVEGAAVTKTTLVDGVATLVGGIGTDVEELVGAAEDERMDEVDEATGIVDLVDNEMGAVDVTADELAVPVHVSIVAGTAVYRASRLVIQTVQEVYQPLCAVERMRDRVKGNANTHYSKRRVHWCSRSQRRPN
jgi:hypothetical protein